MEQAKEQIVTYDYKTIKVRRDMENVASDSYRVLGWELTSSSVAEGAPTYVNLSFRRDRKIENKPQLIRLQDKIDVALSNIELLKKSEKSAGWAQAVITGILGTLIMGGGMSLIMTIGGIAATIAGVVLGIAGIGVVILSHFLRKYLNRRTTLKLNPIIDLEYDKLAEACEKCAEV